MARCSNCGEQVRESDRVYCPMCGAELPSPETGQSTGTDDSNQNQESRDKSHEKDHALDGKDPEDRQNTQAENKHNYESERQTAHHKSVSAPEQQRSEGSIQHTQANQPRQSENSAQSLQEPANKKYKNQSGKDNSGNKKQSQSPKSQTNNPTSVSNKTLTNNIPSASEPSVNGYLWWMGWHPLIVGGTVIGVSLLIGGYVEIDLQVITAFLFIGFTIGTGLWYWGVREINRNYEGFRDTFYSRSASRAENRLGISKNEVIGTFNFRSHSKGSPPLVKSSRRYRAEHMVLSDVSVSVDKGSIYQMTVRETKSTGTTKNIYYDNIETITTNNEGSRTYLRITTSRGENLEVVTVDKRVAEEAQGDLRSKMRDVRRTQP